VCVCMCFVVDSCAEAASKPRNVPMSKDSSGSLSGTQSSALGVPPASRGTYVLRTENWSELCQVCFGKPFAFIFVKIFGHIAHMAWTQFTNTEMYVLCSVCWAGW